MIIFLISLFLILLGMFEKIYFLKLEGLDSMGWLGIVALLVTVLVTILGLVNYKRETTRKIDNDLSLSKPGYVLFIIVLGVIVFSGILNYIKISFDWDSVAMYDARARFLLNGIKFSEMVSLSSFDPKNIYYYLLYPPYTSLIHFFWYKLAIPYSVNLYYTFILLLLSLSIYLLTYKKIGKIVSLVLVFLSIANNVVLFSSLTAYSNLPYSLQMFLSILLLFDYLKDQRKWKLFLGLVLLSGSLWIRYLEPLWLGVVIAFGIVLYVKEKKKKNALITTLFLLYTILEYISWKYFVNKVLGANQVVSFEKSRIIEPIIGVFTGSFISVLLFFFKSWGFMAIVHFSAFYVSLKRLKQNLFLTLVILFNTIIYFAGLYFVSFQSEWWDKLGDSLIRSSTFMIPISGFLLLDFFVNIKRYKNVNK